MHRNNPHQKRFVFIVNVLVSWESTGLKVVLKFSSAESERISESHWKSQSRNPRFPKNQGFSRISQNVTILLSKYVTKYIYQFNSAMDSLEHFKAGSCSFFFIQRFFHLFKHSGIKSISSDGIKFRSTPDSNDFVFVFVGMLFPTPRASRPLTLSRRFSLLQTLLIIDDKFQHLKNIYS